MPAYGCPCVPTATPPEPRIALELSADLGKDWRSFAHGNPALSESAFKQRAYKEIALFVGLLFLGFVIMPIAIYWVGQNVFGRYGGHGYTEFFGNLSGQIRGGDRIAWFFVLSPYLAWQVLRLTRFAWRKVSKKAS